MRRKSLELPCCQKRIDAILNQGFRVFEMGKGCKVVVCGLASVGKTAILEQLLYGNHAVGSESTETQEDVYVASVETDRGVKEQLRLYDTRGLHDGLDLPKHYYSVADGFVLVYSVDSLESFKKVDVLKKEIDKSRDKKEVMVIVLGNKTDLRELRQVEQEAAQQWARGGRRSSYGRTQEQGHAVQ
ncbi:hypothetical protein J4Q44_G00032750 [Coregonus suidteri]|uniref:NF-kappa-B inhibitor-interacting Ras-like protein 1 n=1 Tax=Coregonus suidteri TaxID=861788 RepID=A0AAN8MA70_9TELE